MTRERHRTCSGFKRWLLFSFVGAMGIAVQLLVLFLLTACAHVSYLPATGLAVEAAVLHNYFWHEHWTWADRVGSGRSFLSKFLGFHFANGALSLLGNVVLMRIFVGRLGLHFLYANALSITLCSILNFYAGDRLVFRDHTKRFGMGQPVATKHSASANSHFASGSRSEY